MTVTLIRSEEGDMSNKIELKTCPFCGSDDVRVLDHNCKYNRKDKQTGEWVPSECTTYTVDCFECGCSTDCFNTPEKAAKAWNRRV